MALSAIDKAKIRANLKKLSTSDLVILRWHKRRRKAQICPDPVPKIWWLLGGRGCLAEGTPVWDPSTQQYRNIEKMTEPGWVLTTEGPAISSPSYIKGEAELFRVETAKGNVVLATAEHQFLTQRGFLPLAEIGSDDLIASLDPQALPASVQHCSDTVEDFRNDCRQQPRYDGLQLLLDSTDDLEQLLLLDDALGHNLCESETDDSSISLEDIRLCLDYVLQSRRYSSLDGRQTQADQLPPELLVDEQFQQRLLVVLQFLHKTYPQNDSNLWLNLDVLPQTVSACECLSFDFPEGQRRFHEDAFSELTLEFQTSETGQLRSSPQNTNQLLLEEERSSCVPSSCKPSFFNSKFTSLWVGEPYSEYTTWEKISTVESVGVQRFYDIHVPGPNNYLAAGMFHHNSGKTYTASNHIYEYSATLPFVEENEIVYIALIGSVFDDVKATMIEGKSGLLKIVPEEDLLKWNRTVGEISWKVIGPKGEYREVQCLSYTSEKPDKLRGPNTHLVWIDEYAKFKDANSDPQKAGTTWDNMMKGLRNGTRPHVIVTGTPTDCRLSKYLLQHKLMKLSHMTTIDNRENLPESFFEELMLADPNSRSYRQEVLGELIFDNPDAIFMQETIDNGRSAIPEDASIVYKVLGFDPSASSSKDADECGIILSAYTPEVKEKSGDTGGRPRVIKPTHAYVLKDLSGHYTALEQTTLVIQTMLNEKVNDLVYEQNMGVEYVMQALEQAIKDNTLEYTIRKQAKGKKTDYGIVKRWSVNGVDNDGGAFKFMIYAVHAQSQKKLRAEMVSTRYDSGQIHHPLKDNPLPTCEVHNCRANLENQMTSWDPKNSKYSPDRLDAMAYCMLHIFANFMITRSKVTIAKPIAITQQASQHQAVRGRRRGLVGIYSTDLGARSSSDTADRMLVNRIADSNRNPYSE
jgi:phage terminase large subunit-like protein